MRTALLALVLVTGACRPEHGRSAPEAAIAGAARARAVATGASASAEPAAAASRDAAFVAASPGAPPAAASPDAPPVGPTVARPPVTAPVEGSVRAPLRARWIVRRESSGQAVLVARVERYVGMSVDIDVRVTVPAGVTVEGEAARTIPASDGPLVSEQQITLRFQGAPAGDAVLEASAGAPGFGITARDVYSFGRPRPERPHPEPRGRRVVVGGRDLGPSVPLAN